MKKIYHFPTLTFKLTTSLPNICCLFYLVQIFHMEEILFHQIHMLTTLGKICTYCALEKHPLFSLSFIHRQKADIHLTNHWLVFIVYTPTCNMNNFQFAFCFDVQAVEIKASPNFIHISSSYHLLCYPFKYWKVLDAFVLNDFIFKKSN